MRLDAIRNDYMQLKKEELIKVQARGDAEFFLADQQNFIIVFGCKPGEGVLSNT